MAQENTQTTAPKIKMKKVRNRGNSKVELLVNGKVMVFLPGKTVEVPSDFNIPANLGLYVR